MRHNNDAWLPADRYRLLRKLGAGGMGEVWLADDLRAGRKVAVKRLRPEGAQTEEFQEMRLRFHREFLLLSRFDHPGIVRAYENSDDPERPWFTMEFVEGWMLGEYLQGGHWQGGESSPKYQESPEGLRQVWILGEELLAILARLHADSCIHRDLKPANLMVGRGGRLKLIDFGLAREIVSPLDLTTSGIVGTPIYLSPEQVRGQPLDGRADLYAAGIILYEMSAGRPPFRGSGVHDLLLAHLQQAPENPTSLNPRIIAAHSSFILRLLAKQRAGRPASALEALQALREANRLADRSGATMTQSLLIQPSSLPASQDLLIAPYIGNSVARQAVLDAGAALLRGEGAALLVSGAQGAGKSRLADELRALAAESGMMLWTGNGRSEGGVAGRCFRLFFRQPPPK